MILNFAYLYINEYENHQDKIDFFEQLKKSIELLKNHTINPIIYVYHAPNDTEIQEYCMVNGYIAKPISYHRPFTGLIKILVEKIFILLDFPADQEVVLLDVDTAFKTHVDDSTWGTIPFYGQLNTISHSFVILIKFFHFFPGMKLVLTLTHHILCTILGLFIFQKVTVKKYVERHFGL